MSTILSRWNGLGLEEALEEILRCCGSRVWAHRMSTRRPIGNEQALLTASDEVWNSLTEADWDEAFSSHPRIGETHAHTLASAKSSAWSSEEQHKAGTATADVKLVLAEANRHYEARFHRIFIVCATGKSAQEVLNILERRLNNDPRSELLEAAEQQREITQLRLKKWLAS